RDPELTARTRDAEGWFDTGDLGAVDADGYLHLAGRADDTINVGGRKVQPETVEALALRHRLVLDAACVGWPDRLLGQAPVLYVVMRECPPGWEDEVQAFLRAGLDPCAAPH